MNRRIRDFVSDYVGRNPAIRRASLPTGGIVRADGLDFYPLSRAVRMIAERRGGRIFVICSTDDYASSLADDLSDDKGPDVVLLPSSGKQL